MKKWQRQVFTNPDSSVEHNVLTIDPGIDATGFAYWVAIEYDSQAQAPDATGVSRMSRDQNWDGKVEDLCIWLSGAITALDVHLVVIEMPEVWGASAKSLASAISGDLLKLVYLVGAMGEVVRTKCVRKRVLVTPNEWKGQMPKKVVLRRILRAIDMHYENHAADAVGIGLSLQGKL